MSVTVEISNTENLKTLREILGVEKDSEAVERSIEKTIRDHVSTLEKNGKNSDKDSAKGLPDKYWEELFSEPMLPDNAGSRAVIDGRNEARF